MLEGELDRYWSYLTSGMEQLLAKKNISASWKPGQADILDMLETAEFTDCQLIPGGSNDTFLATMMHASVGSGLSVYKPRRGEAPLWDFPAGTLYLREFAAYELSRLLGWKLVPPTVMREGPWGIGSVQLFIDADLSQHFFTLRDSHREELRRMALFDCLVNNADRKGGHCLLDHEDHIWGIDHGLTFNELPKLRTVIWDYAGEAIPDDLMGDLYRLRERMRNEPEEFETLFSCIAVQERKAFESRLERLLMDPCYPSPGYGRRTTPWPPL